jgi:hypothetical protein
MATEKRESFPGLEDAGNANTGVAKSLKAEGDQAGSGGTNYDATLPCKKPDGTLQFMPLNTAGDAVKVDLVEISNVVCLDDEGTIVDGNASLTILASITLQAEKTYRDLEWVLSCYRNVKAIVEYVDDDGGGGEAVTVLVPGIRAGAGNYNSHFTHKCKRFSTVGGTGVQTLRIRALNTHGLSDINGSLAVGEEQ